MAGTNQIGPCDLYVVNNFSAIKNFVDGLEEEGFIVVAAKEAWSDPYLEAQLAQILPLGRAIEI